MPEECFMPNISPCRLFLRAAFLGIVVAGGLMLGGFLADSDTLIYIGLAIALLTGFCPLIVSLSIVIGEALTTRNKAKKFQVAVPNVDVLDAWDPHLMILKEGVVVLDFPSTQSGPYQQVSPVMDKLASEFRGRIKVARCDVDKNPKVADAYAVSAVPALVFLKDGKVIDRQVGVFSEETLRAKLQELTT
jgi:thioredoxin 1